MTSFPPFRSAVLAVAFGLRAVSGAWADPIVFQNTSHIFGHVTVVENGIPIIVGSSFDTSLTGPAAPTTGSWNLTDSRDVSERGAGARIESSVEGTFAANRITGSGRVQGTASASAVGNVGGQSWGRSVVNVTFRLDQPEVFSYRANYFAETDGIFGALVGRLSPVDLASGSELPPIISDLFQFFPNNLAEQTAHSGVLEPGFYRLILVSDPLFVTAPGSTFRNSGFDVSLEFEPVPEPGSLLLITTGLLGLAVRKRMTSLEGVS